MGFASLSTVKDAFTLFEKSFSIELKTTSKRTKEVLNRVLARDVIASYNLPGFLRSAMDGFAIRAEDTYGASETNPKQLPIIGQIEIGDTDILRVNPGSAIKIATGAPVPEGANAVIKIEDTEPINNFIEIYSSIAQGKNIAQPDEDVKKGQTILAAGTKLLPWDIAILESLAINEVEIYERPRIGTLSTGNELIKSGSIPQIGQVVDSNRPAINAWIKSLGGVVNNTDHVNDDIEEIKNKLLQMALNCDLIITTGGTSVGTSDYLPEVIRDLGDLLVHGVAIRPGKPIALGVIKLENKSIPIIGLPGYPLAAFINFKLFAAPVICRLTKKEIPWSKVKKITLGQKIASKVGSRDFVRLLDTPQGAKLIRITGAGILSSIVNADYLLEIPEDIEGYNEGDLVEVMVLR